MTPIFRRSIVYSFLFFSYLTLACSEAKRISQEVRITGEMRNVMWKGELAGNIHMDTISDKTGLYGMGPIEFLRGEIMIMDGRSFSSRVTSDTSMMVRESYDLKAPFFAYSNIHTWREINIPDTVQTLSSLESYLHQLTRSNMRPFMFKLEGTIKTAIIHVVNLPEGSKVSSPAEAHEGQVNFHLENENVEILGFFSTNHKAIFTHHDTFLHMHLITKDLKKMGHLDQVSFHPENVRLFLPASDL